MEASRVTSTHFTVPGQTFAISDIQAVRFQKNSSGPWPTVCYLLGIGAFLKEVFRLGLILFILGAIISTIFRPKFTVVLETVSGEVRAFTSSDRNYIAEIVNALKKAAPGDRYTPAQRRGR